MRAQEVSLGSLAVAVKFRLTNPTEFALNVGVLVDFEWVIG